MEKDNAVLQWWRSLSYYRYYINMLYSTYIPSPIRLARTWISSDVKLQWPPPPPLSRPVLFIHSRACTFTQHCMYFFIFFFTEQTVARSVLIHDGVLYARICILLLSSYGGGGGERKGLHNGGRSWVFLLLFFFFLHLITEPVPSIGPFHSYESASPPSLVFSRSSPLIIQHHVRRISIYTRTRTRHAPARTSRAPRRTRRVLQDPASQGSRGPEYQSYIARFDTFVVVTRR